MLNVDTTIVFLHLEVSRSHHAAAKGSSVSTAQSRGSASRWTDHQCWSFTLPEVRPSKFACLSPLLKNAADVLALLRCLSLIRTALRAMAFSDVPSTCDASISDYFILQTVDEALPQPWDDGLPCSSFTSRLNRILRRSRLKERPSKSRVWQEQSRNLAKLGWH